MDRLRGDHYGRLLQPGGQRIDVLGRPPLGGVARVTWGSTPRMVADVQGWLDDPSSNYGRRRLGNEETEQRTAKRFESRENPDESRRPTLLIEYLFP